jgi:hypothetical protein|tara:strand:- start:984 stop:1607 length:624 start_codon:yes stop_codon:yes gene_type:complete
MTSITTATSELEAINTMLSTIGEAPVSSLTGTLPNEVTMAVATLNEVNREVQTRGWHFNTELEYPLSKNVDNKIPLATNIVRLEIIPSKYSKQTYDCVQRGAFLYNRQGRTFVFDKDLDGTAVILLDFTEIPESARRYITIRASRMFLDRMIGSSELRGYTQQDEIIALSTLKQAETSTADHNIFNNYDTYRIIDRNSSSIIDSSGN